MFRRKDEEFEGENADLLGHDDDDAIDTGHEGSDSASPVAAVASTPVSSMTPKPAPAPVAPAASFRPAPANMPAPRAASTAITESRNSATVTKVSKRVLTVGNDIHMKGEISTCDRLVIEGSVDATLKDVHTVELAQTGSFKGTAEIQDAEISGIFEGDLIVHGRLIIYSTGKVSGNIAYGEIEIERGGQISGTIKTSAEVKAGQGRKAA